ncbi:MAG: HEAT repeat domain-containing protein [Deferribacteraceae bacterium]|jgi:anti-anti-sigma regulatory factor|nr:HEAT repeat domain-containing protein [Deferribacteraceae bacterium]
MNVRIEALANELAITVLDGVQRKDFEEVFSTLKGFTGGSIKVDLKNLQYIKSDIIAQLLALRRAADSKKAALKLVNLSDGVLSAFETANLTKHFTIEQDYGSYTVSELIELLHDDEQAEFISIHIGLNFNEQYRKALLDALKIDDPVLNEQALLSLGRAGDDASIDVIRSALASQYPNVVCAAVLVLGWLGDAASKEKLYELISSPEEAVSEACGASIALLSDDGDPARLKTLLKDSEPPLRKVIANALALINGGAAYNILKEMLSKETIDDVRSVLVRKISYFNNEDATNTLIEALDDSSRKVQETAAAGLERTGLRGGEERVFKKISGDDWVSYFAVRALGKHCSEKVADYLTQRYPNLSGKVRLAVVEVLGAASYCTSFLAERLNEDNEDIRREALSGLYRSNKPLAVEKAVQLAKGDPSWLVRFKAVEIIIAETPEGYRDILAEIRNSDANRYIQDKIDAVLGS